MKLLFATFLTALVFSMLMAFFDGADFWESVLVNMIGYILAITVIVGLVTLWGWAAT